eukprot:11769334-Alexandrium_andersonii.AAC.1
MVVSPNDHWPAQSSTDCTERLRLETALPLRLDAEWRQHCTQAVGTLIVGDLNVHNILWLRFSSHNSAEERALQQWCSTLGFEER